MLIALLALLASACTDATAHWVPVESVERADTADTATTGSTGEIAAKTAPQLAESPAEPAARTQPDEAPEGLAYAPQPEPAAAPKPAIEDDSSSEQAPYSPELCEASANAWVASAALNLLGDDTNTRTYEAALGSVSEWFERSTVYDEPGAAGRVAALSAFEQLALTARADFGADWSAYRASESYTESPAAQIYETGRSALATLVHDTCDGYTIDDLALQAKTEADELSTEHLTAPSTITESDSLPGHAIFTHSSGRLIASFPSAWSHEERTNASAIVDLIASPDIERFLAGEAIDGVHLQLVDAATIDMFRDQIDRTMVATLCNRTEDIAEAGLTRLTVTQTFACSDHGASIVGQYRESNGRGLIIEASFDSTDASRMDLTRLASIANSALWS